MHPNRSHVEIFIPNYPPPGFNAQQPSPFLFNAPPQPLNHFDIYKNRLSTYLQNRNRSTVKSLTSTFRNPRKMIIKLSECTAELRQSYALIGIINKELEKLSENAVNLTEDERQLKLAEINQKKAELVAIVAKYKDPCIQTEINYAIEQRKAKRHRIKLRKAETKELKHLEAKRRQQKHEKIDKWFAENAQNIADERRRIQAEQKASIILSNVHQRKAEAQNYISLFDSLKELHQLRSRKKKGERFREGDIFSKEMDELKAQWMEALAKYNEEEQRLQSIVNDNSNLNEWRSVLFGSSTEAILGSGGFTGVQNLKELISIRKQWDAFLVPEENPFGLAIPVGWVMPNSKPSDKWKVYQRNNIIK